MFVKAGKHLINSNDVRLIEYKKEQFVHYMSGDGKKIADIDVDEYYVLHFKDKELISFDISLEDGQKLIEFLYTLQPTDA